MRKGILTPPEVISLYTHWPELSYNKLDRFMHRTTRHAKVFDRSKGTTIEGMVLACPSILVMPFRDGRMVLNGKHRAVIAGAWGFGLEYYEVERLSDIDHALPRALYQKFELPPNTPYSSYVDEDSQDPQWALKRLYEQKEGYHTICKSKGTVIIADHIEQLDDKIVGEMWWKRLEIDHTF